jgi:hypothetical protein
MATVGKLPEGVALKEVALAPLPGTIWTPLRGEESVEEAE